MNASDALGLFVQAVDLLYMYDGRHLVVIQGLCQHSTMQEEIQTNENGR